MSSPRFVLAVLALGIASSSFAAVSTVLPGDPAWGNPPGENSGGGSSAITNTAPRSGNGSLELFGDRTRFFGLGSPYNPASNLGLLSSLTSITFDWSIAPGSTSPLGNDYTPALRLHLWDGAQRSELIWEGAYNGTYGSTTPGTWYSSGADDNFWQFQSGIGATLIYNRSVADWQSIYGSGAYIAAVSVGVGSSAGGSYHAFADNVTLTFAGGASTTYNFETRSASVPDSGSTIALLGAALIAVAACNRRLAHR
jgi:hypothetical protein